METTKLDIVNNFTLLPENIRTEILKELIENDKEKVYINNLNQQLSNAAREGNNEIVNMMIRFGADKDVKNAWGFTPLHWAAIEGHTDTVKLLLDLGADKEVIDGFIGMTPLHVAAAHGRTDIVKVLMDVGADKDARVMALETVSLTWALDSEPNWEGVEDSDSKTPLHLAAEGGHTNTVKLLLKAKAKVDAKDKKGRTPVLGAIKENHIDVVKVFMDYGVDLQKIFQIPITE